jgi:hypothetical protein
VHATAAGPLTAAGGIPGILSILFFATTLSVAVVIAIKQRVTKVLVWEPGGLYSLIHRPVSDLSSELEVRWRGERIGTAFVSRIRLTNAGRQAIDAADYLQYPILRYKDARCLEINFVGSNPTGLQTSTDGLDFPAADIRLLMPTMNCGDWIEIELVLEGKVQYPEVATRIKGQTKEMTDGRHARSRRTKQMSAIAFLLGAALTAGSFALLNQDENSKPGLIFFLLGPILLVLGLVSYIATAGRLAHFHMDLGAPPVDDWQKRPRKRGRHETP